MHSISEQSEKKTNTTYLWQENKHVFKIQFGQHFTKNLDALPLNIIKKEKTCFLITYLCKLTFKKIPTKLFPLNIQLK